MRFYVHCSKGTYIRSLIHDFGERLGCGAVMTYLKRVKNGSFELEKIKAYSPDELKTTEEVEDALLPADYVFQDLKALTLNPFC